MHCGIYIYSSKYHVLKKQQHGTIMAFLKVSWYSRKMVFKWYFWENHEKHDSTMILFLKNGKYFKYHLQKNYHSATIFWGTWYTWNMSQNYGIICKRRERVQNKTLQVPLFYHIWGSLQNKVQPWLCTCSKKHGNIMGCLQVKRNSSNSIYRIKYHHFTIFQGTSKKTIVVPR